MKRLVNISIVSLSLVALFAGAALAEAPDLYSDDESGYQDQAAGFKALLDNDSAPASQYPLQNKIDTELSRSFSEVQISPDTYSADEKARFLTVVARTNVITDELGFE